ncbi:MAG: phosphate signaling complex protein PhoU [Planctomycetota bacterium]|nr:phosphate signaling complex protein PhoU [Planctomycetota bacterium]MDA1113157.1 phosphate signaling complex protein PhoU [Planctomycetota bacterium]
MTKHFMRDLGALAEQLVHISNRCEDAFGRAIDSILSRDAEGALEVVQGDASIDELEVKLEEAALKILALHAPVAGDLRFLIAAIKINNDLERIADIASNIAKRTIDLKGLAPISPPAEFELMAQQTRVMVRETIQALVRRDEDRARKVLKMDDIVDGFNRNLLKRIEAQMGQEPESVPALMRWANVVRLVERIADYATNIAEDIIYMEQGDIVRHGESGKEL